MIPITDLRINNLVWDEEDNPVVIVRIDAAEIGSEIVIKPLNVTNLNTTYKVTNNTSIFPIPALNHISLSALGFHQPISSSKWQLKVNNDIKMFLVSDKPHHVFLKVNSFRKCVPFQIEGVHSIQNLYYTFSGQDVHIYL